MADFQSLADMAGPGSNGELTRFRVEKATARNSAALKLGRAARGFVEIYYGRASLAAIALSAPAFGQVAPDTEPQAEESAGGIQDIIVTAQRREDNIFRLSGIHGAALAAAGPT